MSLTLESFDTDFLRDKKICFFYEDPVVIEDLIKAIKNTFSYGVVISRNFIFYSEFLEGINIYKTYSKCFPPERFFSNGSYIIIDETTNLYSIEEISKGIKDKRVSLFSFNNSCSYFEFDYIFLEDFYSRPLENLYKFDSKFPTKNLDRLFDFLEDDEILVVNLKKSSCFYTWIIEQV